MKVLRHWNLLGTRPVAEEIFARWANRPDPGQSPDSLLGKFLADDVAE